MVDFNRARPAYRPRRKAMAVLALTVVGWVSVHQFGEWWHDRAPALHKSPRFFVDLQRATEDELRLLPEVGSKTAHAWRQTLDEPGAAVPRHVKGLEALPNVGPIRSSKLAPFLVESEARATTSLDSTLKTSRPSATP